MAKKLGNEYRLWVDSATAGTFIEIKGQTSLKINRQAGNVDTSDKAAFPYGTSLPGRRVLTVDVELFPDLPDAGYTRLETLSQASPQAPVMFQIRKGGSTGEVGDVVFHASMNIGNVDTEYPDNAPIKTNGQLTLAAPPLVDTLA